LPSSCKLKINVAAGNPVILDVNWLSRPVAMERNPVFRITEDDIENLSDRTRDQTLIDAYACWVHRGDELDSLIRTIEDAFAGLTLGDGIGLLEANGLDDYAGKDELAELRSRGEHSDWRRIDVGTLNR